MKKLVLLSVCMLFFLAFANAQGQIIDDAVQGTGNNQHNYVGAGWVHGSTSPSFYNSTLSYTNVAGSYVEITFVGNEIQWFTERKNTHGIVAISVDGGQEFTLDLYSSTEEHVRILTVPFTQGTHTLRIRATGTKNPASSGFYAIHDGFVIFQGTTLPPESTNTAGGVGSMENLGIPGLPGPGGFRNSAFGFHAIHSSYSSYDNTAVGYNVLSSTILATGNTAIGSNAIGSAAKAHFNTAVGYSALAGSLILGEQGNTGVGAFALDVQSKGAYNTAIGYRSGPAVNLIQNSTALGSDTRTTASNQVRIGSSGVTSIGGQVSWSTLSDGRFKKDVKDDISGLAFINDLRPVSYTVDKSALRAFLGESDSVNRFAAKSKEIPSRQTGFVAQEVDALVKKSGYVFNGVDAPQNEKDPYSIRYAEFVVPLVKAVQELSATVEEQQIQIDQLLKKLDKQGSGDDLNAREISLLQNHPNPFSANTEIRMVLPESVINANVIVYNLEGKQLKEMKVSQRGNTNVTIIGNELAAGMYIYALIADGKVIDTKRMILTK